MSFKKILVPTDGSELTKDAVRVAIELALLSGGKITAFCVLDSSAYASMAADAAAPNIYETLEEEGRHATGYVAEKAGEAGVEVDEKLADGIPAKAIIHEVEAGGYDIVVMGSLGRTGVSKFLMGSVAEKVVQNAKCPVLVVKPIANHPQP